MAGWNSLDDHRQIKKGTTLAGLPRIGKLANFFPVLFQKDEFKQYVSVGGHKGWNNDFRPLLYRKYKTCIIKDGCCCQPCWTNIWISQREQVWPSNLPPKVSIHKVPVRLQSEWYNFYRLTAGRAAFIFDICSYADRSARKISSPVLGAWTPWITCIHNGHWFLYSRFDILSEWRRKLGIFRSN